jgi:hypothetical protein
MEDIRRYHVCQYLARQLKNGKPIPNRTTDRKLLECINRELKRLREINRIISVQVVKKMTKEAIRKGILREQALRRRTVFQEAAKEERRRVRERQSRTRVQK